MQGNVSFGKQCNTDINVVFKKKSDISVSILMTILGYGTFKSRLDEEAH